MGFSVIRNLVTYSRFQDEVPSVLKLGMQLTFQAKKDMPLGAPVIGKIAR